MLKGKRGRSYGGLPVSEVVALARDARSARDGYLVAVLESDEPGVFAQLMDEIADADELWEELVQELHQREGG